MDRPPPDGELFLRWSKGPQVDLPDGGSSRDTLTGIALPGLSANPLAVGLGAGSWGPLDRVGSRREGETSAPRPHRTASPHVSRRHPLRRVYL